MFFEFKSDFEIELDFQKLCRKQEFLHRIFKDLTVKTVPKVVFNPK